MAVPIANCLVHDQLRAEFDGDALTALWSEESGIGSEQMTINVIASIRQYGAPYRVMAFLYLPSLWKSEQVRKLQTGLARALGRGFAVAPAEIQVITSMVESGQVVEGGETQDW
jgi:hypothetical protein